MIPDYAHDDLINYRERGIPLCDTFRCIVIGDLFGAVKRADNNVLPAIGEIAAWIVMEWPMGAYGSAKNYDEWLEYHRLKREAIRQLSERCPIVMDLAKGGVE